jgi:hypothetical protein
MSAIAPDQILAKRERALEQKAPELAAVAD